jgi:hypothetical protein
MAYIGEQADVQVQGTDTRLAVAVGIPRPQDVKTQASSIDALA